MPDQSIHVIEDIDCTIMLQNRETENEERSTRKNQVTLSGLLNLIDGLWSCCTDERIIIFTTNHKEKLDPVLVRPERMDMHIHMSYCTISALKQLVFNYHGLCPHQLFEQIEEMLKLHSKASSISSRRRKLNKIMSLKLTPYVQKKSTYKKEEEEKSKS
ncbi:unnamed protein product [Prunus armeniaca]|uniref:ATPase AAA-type core domain-containing protein n=1 Tax=Prunus armeniaca TaxID=36596 RepID=A0A6J5UMI6_PRUAR|nr:unnamed protein product [Prunus armeniaca]